jgi:hypothetical protein
LSDAVTALSLEQVRVLGLEALSEKLGPVGYVRFLQQYDTGYGDYTRDRHLWMDRRSAREIGEDIIRGRQCGDAP